MCLQIRILIFLQCSIFELGRSNKHQRQARESHQQWLNPVKDKLYLTSTLQFFSIFKMFLQQSILFFGWFRITTCCNFITYLFGNISIQHCTHSCHSYSPLKRECSPKKLYRPKFELQISYFE